jgi:putative transposase
MPEYGHAGSRDDERFFNKIKQFGRIVTRYNKLAANYLGFIERAAIGI